MSFLHGRHRRRVALLAAGALDGGEQRAALAHLDRCQPCRAEHAGLEASLALLARDPAREAEPLLSAAALTARVVSRLEQAAPRSRRWAPVFAASAAATLAVAVSAGWLLRSGPTPAGEAPRVLISESALDRLERTVAREHAARYLSAAQDVLATVASRPPRCHRDDRRVDVTDEARRSRELLARRALLVETDGDAVAAVRPVIEDVDLVLREVASLDPCVRPQDVSVIQDQIERRQLLMKIRLTTRELLG